MTGRPLSWPKIRLDMSRRVETAISSSSRSDKASCLFHERVCTIIDDAAASHVQDTRPGRYCGPVVVLTLRLAAVDIDPEISVAHHRHGSNGATLDNGHATPSTSLHGRMPPVHGRGLPSLDRKTARRCSFSGPRLPFALQEHHRTAPLTAAQRLP
ncbi:hypothetical protein FKP32DRAFT_690064 [Trametes sanguinea]|nr:hypothetical protein FKP32DRAFT_690064 [Trametes sanguinea]